MKKKCFTAIFIIAIVFTLLPVAIFAQNDPVITNLTVTRDSETTATITFDSSKNGNVAIIFKDSNGEYGFYLHDKDGVVIGHNTITITEEDKLLSGNDGYEIAVYFGEGEDDFNHLYSSQNPLNEFGAVKDTVPEVHNCTSTGTYQHNDTNHWQLCDICDKKINDGTHSNVKNEWKSDGTNHWQVCDACNAEYNKSSHTSSGVWQSDATHHWQVCEQCDEIINKAAHSGGTATTTTKANCEVCGQAYGDLLSKPSSSKPSKEPSKPSKPACDPYDLNCDGVVTCEEKYGEDWYWNEEAKACLVKDYSGIIVDTATR